MVANFHNLKILAYGDLKRTDDARILKRWQVFTISRFLHTKKYNTYVQITRTQMVASFHNLNILVYKEI